jgi:hypothetical protein
MIWKPDEEKVIQLLDKAFNKYEWVQPQDLEKLGIAPERLCPIIKLMQTSRLMVADAFGLMPTREAVEEWRRIEAGRRNWYKRARNWCETNRVVAIILVCFGIVVMVNGLKDFVQFLWNLLHPNVPPTP